MLTAGGSGSGEAPRPGGRLRSYVPAMPALPLSGQGRRSRRSGQRHLPDPSLRLPDPSLRPGQGSYCRAAALHAGRSRRGPAHHRSGTRSCAGGRQDRRTRLTGLSREGFQGTGAVRIQGETEMKFCTACGEAARGQRFCTRCGAVLRAQPGQAAGQFQTTTDPGPTHPGPALAGRPGLRLVQLESPGPDPYESGQPPGRPSRPGRHAAQPPSPDRAVTPWPGPGQSAAQSPAADQPATVTWVPPPRAPLSTPPASAPPAGPVPPAIGPPANGPPAAGPPAAVPLGWSVPSAAPAGPAASPGQGPSAGQRPPGLPPAWQWPAAESERLARWPPTGPAPARTTPGAVAHSGAGPSFGGLPGRERRRIWLIAVIVVLLAAAGAAGGWFFLSHRSHPAARVATAPARAAHSHPVSAGPGGTSAGGGGSAAAQMPASPAPS